MMTAIFRAAEEVAVGAGFFDFLLGWAEANPWSIAVAIAIAIPFVAWAGWAAINSIFG